MKNLKSLSFLLVVPFFLMFLFACQEGSSLVAPDNTSNNSLKKKAASVEFVTTSVTQLVTAKDTTEIELKGSFEGGIKKKVEFFAKLVFLPKSVSQDTYVTMEMDPESGMIDFSPGMKFKKSAILSFGVKGMDLKKVDPKDIEFVYFDVDGNRYSYDYSKLKIDLKKGEIKIKDAEIPHFSRYGFTK